MYRLIEFVTLLLFTVVLLESALASPQQTDVPERPFSPTTPTQGNGSTAYCVAGFNDCSTVGRSDACCSLTQVCTFDELGNLGCCEFGVKCVGEIPRRNSSGVVHHGTLRLRTIIAVCITAIVVGARFGSV
ncbi:hypothetical protein BDZ91DRAFT_714488, partial [Kalaharituber pfeilii]